MNTLNGKIVSIEQNGSLTLITTVVDDVVLKSIVIETPESATYFKEGNVIKVLFKETEVILGTGNISNNSLLNRIPGTVVSIEKGTLLCKIILETNIGKIVAVILTSALEFLNLTNGQPVTAMIKSNEILLSE